MHGLLCMLFLFEINPFIFFIDLDFYCLLKSKRLRILDILSFSDSTLLSRSFRVIRIAIVLKIFENFKIVIKF